MKKISRRSHPSNKIQSLKTGSKSRPLAATSAKTWPHHKAFKSPFKSRRFSHSRKSRCQPTLRVKKTTVSPRVTRHQSCISQHSTNLLNSLSLKLKSGFQSCLQHRIAERLCLTQHLNMSKLWFRAPKCPLKSSTSLRMKT